MKESYDFVYPQKDISINEFFFPSTLVQFDYKLPSSLQNLCSATEYKELIDVIHSNSIYPPDGCIKIVYVLKIIFLLSLLLFVFCVYIRSGCVILFYGSFCISLMYAQSEDNRLLKNRRFQINKEIEEFNVRSLQFQEVKQQQQTNNNNNNNLDKKYYFFTLDHNFFVLNLGLWSHHFEFLICLRFFEGQVPNLYELVKVKNKKTTSCSV